MLKWFSADLHIHTVLSPCAELDMGPINIVEAAEKLDMDIIGITDHNSAANVAAVMERADQRGLVVIGGIEVQTREEVHVLCLFPGLEQLSAYAAYIRSRLPKVPNQPEVFGDQVVVNGEEEILYFEETLLLSSVMASLEEVVARAVAWGGLVIPAHIDRPSFSVLSNLGFIPPQLPVAALEIAWPERISDILSRYPSLAQYCLVSFSDAHTLSQLERGFCTYFYLQEPTFIEIKRAFAGEGGRRVVIERAAKVN
ncbi:MAG: PHP domain-containing protein [Firmicutes bacterium]|nr:PHP domain-containing protein [Bacillota bacterium]